MKFNPFKNSYVPEKQITGNNKKYKQIIQMTPYRVSPSIDEYTHALDSAKSKVLQSRILLYDNYIATLDLDAMVVSLLNKRFGNLENKSIELVNKDTNEVDDNYKEFLNSPRFKEFVMDILNTKFWGFNVFEFNTLVTHNQEYFDYYLFPHKHINPYSKEVLKYQYDSKGISFKNKADIMMIGDSDNLGLLSQIALLSIYKRFGMFNYSRYSELAAENFTQIQAGGATDAIQMQKLQSDILDRGRGGLLNTPEGVNLDFQNQSSSSQNQLFENYQTMIKEEMAILILGQTMTSFDGSSRSQAEVHSDEQDSLFASDERFILNTLNFDFKEYLNYWFADFDSAKYEFKFKINSSVELKKQLDEYKELKELGIMFTDEELRTKFKDLL
jgi:hypothetical protein